MATAPAAMIVSQDKSLDVQAYRAAGVFISYASEDQDIAQAVFQSLQCVGETIYDRVHIFLDSKSIGAGSAISDEIKAGLRKSDFLIVLYTGVFKRSHGFTGWEVGFFAGLIEDDLRDLGRTTRKIIYLYTDEPPSVGAGILGISINVEATDLAGTRDEYAKKCKQSPDDPDALARIFLEIAGCAEDRLPPPMNDQTELERKRTKRAKSVAEEIIPTLRGKLFDSMGQRVTRRSVEQKLIEFEFPKPAPDQAYVSIPDEARLTPHAGALDIFSISQQNDTIKWSDFCRDIKSRYSLGGTSIVLAIEQAVVSAISPALRRDNDQILKSASGTIYRILVTRQLDYYNGRKVVHVYFVELLQSNPVGDPKTSTILGFINVAARYRFLFIERESPLSVEAFMFEHEPAKIQDKVKQLVRELLLIEQESGNLKLDQVASISSYFGSDERDFAAARVLQEKWLRVRTALMTAAEKVLCADPASDKFAAVNGEWLTVLKEFRSVSDLVNSTATTRALENLKQSFVELNANP